MPYIYTYKHYTVKCYLCYQCYMLIKYYQILTFKVIVRVLLQLQLGAKLTWYQRTAPSINIFHVFIQHIRYLLVLIVDINSVLFALYIGIYYNPRFTGAIKVHGFVLHVAYRIFDILIIILIRTSLIYQHYGAHCTNDVDCRLYYHVVILCLSTYSIQLI